MNDEIILNNLKFRPADNSDAEEITGLIFGVLEEYGLSTDPEKTDADLKNIEGNYFSRGGCFYVVTENEKIVGTVGLFPVDGKVCELRKMYLPKAQRGKGLGKYLLEFSLRRAKELGFAKIILETASVLKEAVALYTKYGFRKYDACHISCRCDQSYYLDI